jgi:hypothetical protein
MLCDFFMIFYLWRMKKSNKQKTYWYFEGHWRKEQDPEPDLLDRATGPRIRILNLSHLPIVQLITKLKEMPLNILFFIQNFYSEHLVS